MFEVPGRLPGMNEYQEACRRSAVEGGRMKREATDSVAWCAKAAGVSALRTPIDVRVTWVEPNMRRDKDNIRAGMKFVLDGLVEAGAIPNDGWRQIGSLSDDFKVNKDNPRVVVEITESEER